MAEIWRVFSDCTFTTTTPYKHFKSAILNSSHIICETKWRHRYTSLDYCTSCFVSYGEYKLTSGSFYQCCINWSLNGMWQTLPFGSSKVLVSACVAARVGRGALQSHLSHTKAHAEMLRRVIAHWDQREEKGPYS